MRDTPFKSGDELLAEDLEWMRQQIIKVLRVAAPLQISNTAGGIYISSAGGDGGSQAGVFTTINHETEDEETEYPEAGDDPTPYYAQQETPDFEEELGGEYSSEAGNEAWVFNLSAEHIPVGKQIVAFKISGKWYTYFRTSGPRIVEGTLDENLTAHGTADMTVWDDAGEDTEETVEVEDRAGWAAASGQYVMAIKWGTTLAATYRPIVIGCVQEFEED